MTIQEKLDKMRDESAAKLDTKKGTKTSKTYKIQKRDSRPCPRCESYCYGDCSAN